MRSEMYPNTVLEMPLISSNFMVVTDAEQHDKFVVHTDAHETLLKHAESHEMFNACCISLQFRTLTFALSALNDPLHVMLQPLSIVKDWVTSRLPTISFLSPVRFFDDRELNPSCAISIV